MKVIIWHNTRILQGEMITSFPRTFCLSWDLEVQKELSSEMQGGLQGTPVGGGMRAATAHWAAEALELLKAVERFWV